MTYKNLCLEVPSDCLQSFSHGGQVTALIPTYWNLAEGDWVSYKTYNGGRGTARVCKVKETVRLENDRESVVCVFEEYGILEKPQKRRKGR